MRALTSLWRAEGEIPSYETARAGDLCNPAAGSNPAGDLCEPAASSNPAGSNPAGSKPSLAQRRRAGM